MSILVCGAMSYDNTMVFRDHFKNHVLQDQAHLFSVAFQISSFDSSFGGSAGNIVYGLKLLGVEALPMATVGSDFSEYSEWLKKNHISQQYIRIIREEKTAQIYTICDLDGNQISAVEAKALNRSHLNSIFDVPNVHLGYISGEGKKGTLLHAQEFKWANIPFILDPGKQISHFSDIELTQLVHQASYIVVNDYEWEMLHTATGMRENDILKYAKALIITYGGKGALILTEQEKFEIPGAKARDQIDPIGCGDAFRAGIIYGIDRGLNWETTGRIASLMGAIKMEHRDTQNYQFTTDEFSQRYQRNFGSPVGFDRRRKPR